jgi:hypothetical protein
LDFAYYLSGAKLLKKDLLSGGRKNGPFGSGFKPATLPDLQNGNARQQYCQAMCGRISHR